MASLLDQMLEELNTEKPVTELSHEGFDDYEDVNLKHPAHQVALTGKQKWGHRLELLINAIEALEALKDDGYPDPHEIFVEEDATLEDLDDQIESLTAARSHVKKRPGVTHGRFKFSDIGPS